MELSAETILRAQTVWLAQAPPLLRKSYEEIPLGARRESNELFARLYSPMHGLEFALLQNCEEGAGRRRRASTVRGRR